MTDEDRELIKQLIIAVADLTRAIQDRASGGGAGGVLSPHQGRTGSGIVYDGKGNAIGAYGGSSYGAGGVAGGSGGSTHIVVPSSKL